jgi:hypothetical protein
MVLPSVAERVYIPAKSAYTHQFPMALPAGNSAVPEHVELILANERKARKSANRDYG